MSVDVSLYPLDTLKTRMQAAEGFFKAGGFRGVYSGVSAAAAGSFPTSALFFATYELVKPPIANMVSEKNESLSPMIAASCGEVVACIVRVPTEIVKQRMQTGVYTSFITAVQQISKTEGVRGFFTGYGTTVAREVPFSFIQFPIYEALKKAWAKKQKEQITPMQGAICGSIAGSTAAAVTTPLDVIKTRLMLGKDSAARSAGLIETARIIVAKGGVSQLFSGIVPRTIWTTIGGFVFFGAYEQATAALQPDMQEET